MGLRLQAETSVTSTEKVPELTGVIFKLPLIKSNKAGSAILTII